MRPLHFRPGLATALACLLAATVAAGTQEAVPIPPDAATLEGVPAVRIDAGEDGATRRVLEPAEASRDRLVVSIVDGRFYWTSRDNRPLSLQPAGEFTYLSSAEPGRYIRLTKLHDRIAYVEHVDMASGSVTWWGELRIVTSK